MKPIKQPTTVLRIVPTASLEDVRAQMHHDRMRRFWARLCIVAVLGIWINAGVAVYACWQDHPVQLILAIIWLCLCMLGALLCVVQEHKHTSA